MQGARRCLSCATAARRTSPAAWTRSARINRICFRERTRTAAVSPERQQPGENTMAHKELIDTRTARELLGIGPSTLAMLIERDDLGDTYWWSHTRNQKRILLDRERVE